MILIDPPMWPAHGRLWSHLVSDVSYEELHAFARAKSVPRRGFDRDHYDVPDHMYATLVAAGAVPVSSRELVRRLAASGLRRRKTNRLVRMSERTTCDDVPPDSDKPSPGFPTEPQAG